MSRKIVGDYSLDEVIMETANSILYKAKKQNSTGELDELYYVVKEYTNEEYADMAIEREKNIAHSIENNCTYSIIIPILETFEQEGKRYGVMQFRKNGMFLSEILKKMESAYKDDAGSLPLDSQMVVLHNVLASLDKLHNCMEDAPLGIKGYVHNDIHPGNIFFENIDFESFILYSSDVEKAKEYLGTAKFIDLQNATPIGDEVDSSAMIGNVRCYTHGYTAPEMLEESDSEFDSESVGVASDIYSVAAVAARLYVGREIDELDTDFRDMLEQKWYSTINAGIQSIYKRLINIGLKYEPKYRFSNSNDMKKSLEKVMDYYQALKTNDLYTLLGTAFDVSMSFNELGLTDSDFDTKRFDLAVKSLNQETYTASALYDRCLYIFNGLWKLKPDSISPETHNMLINAGIACYNRYGRHREATKLADQVIISAFSLDEYIGFNIRMAEIYKDEMEYKKAYDMVKTAAEALEQLGEAKKEIAISFGLNETRVTKDVMLGRAYSAMGRYMTILGMDGGLDYFERALEHFDQDNKKITYSHILQYAIFKKDKSLYESYAALYYEDDSIFMLKDAKASSLYLESLAKDVNQEGFRLLVFLKGVDAFYSDRLGDFALQYERIIRQGTEEGTVKQYHPIELIWKYTGILYFKKTHSVDDSLARFFKYSSTAVGKNVINHNKPLNIMMLISYRTIWEYNKLCGADDKNVKLMESLELHCKKSGWNMLWNCLEEKDDLDSLLTYEEI